MNSKHGMHFPLREEDKGSSKKDFHIMFVPRKTILCERRLQVSNKTLLVVTCEIVKLNYRKIYFSL
jgi:hypothetical protein